MLQRGDSVPHFEVRTVDGEPFSYSSIWQRKNLLLVALPALDSESSNRYVTESAARLREFSGEDVQIVITRERIPGIAALGVLVADRWGEIVFAAEASDVDDLPPPRELIEWLQFVRNQCPECEGEAR